MSNPNVAARRSGKVVEKMAFGVIVDLGGSDDGLLHVSRMRGGSRFARDARNNRLAVGDSVEVEVVEEKRSGDRVKLTLSERWHDDVVMAELRRGSTVSAQVARLLDSGVIATITGGVAEGVDGFVHVSELPGADPKARDRQLEAMRIGQSLELEVLKTERDEQGDLRVKLSRRSVVMRGKVAGTFAPGTTHTGRVVRRTDEGFIVSFGDFSGLLPESELGKAGAGSIRCGSNTRTKVVGIDEAGVLRLTRRGL